MCPWSLACAVFPYRVGGSVKDAYFFKIHPFLCEFIPAWYIGVEDIEKIDYSPEML